MMVSSAVLGAAAGTGLALLAAMTLVLWRYHKKGRKESGDLERFETAHSSSLKKSWQPFKQVGRWDSRGSTKSCPPVYTFPHQEFNMDQEQRIIQPLQPSFASLPEVRGKGNYSQEILRQQQHDPLTHQSRSLPTGPAIPGARLNRTPSIQSQALIESVARKGHRGSSPAIRTFTPEGLTSGISPPDSPPLQYFGSRSPSPLHVRTASVESKSGEGKSPNHSQSSLASQSDTPILSLRRHSRCSPLLILPKSPTLSETSSPGPLSPLLGSLQVDLYQKKDLTLFIPARESRGALGRIHLRLKYDLDKSDLNVHVIEAHELAGSDQGGFNDPYIRLSLEPEVDARKRQTKIHRNDPNPFFNEEFKFPVSQDDLKDKRLVLQVFDYDRYSRNDVVGEVTVKLDDFNVTTNLEIWAEVAKNKQPSGERQEILVSLSYLPSAERLTVVLLKARNLYSPPNKDSLDPYVKVYLILNGRRLKKKKTSARKNTANPVWNEAVSFSLPPSALSNAAIEICVADQSNDLIGGSNSSIGSSLVGPRETGIELSHWQDMTQNFRKSIAQWHVLT